jgi:hypothetical protein
MSARQVQGVRWSFRFRCYYYSHDPAYAPLRIGSTRYSRYEMATLLGLTNVLAAHKLTLLCDSMKIKSIQQFATRFSPSTLKQVEGIGDVTVIVAQAAIEHAGLASDKWKRIDDGAQGVDAPTAKQTA